MENTDLIQQLLTVLLQLAAILASIAIAWVSATAKRKWGIDIEAKHREALHSAIMTGARAAIEAVGTTSTTMEPTKLLNGARAEAIAYAKKSVPDAIAFFSPLPDVLDRLAISAVQEILAKRLRR